MHENAIFVFIRCYAAAHGRRLRQLLYAITPLLPRRHAAYASDKMLA